MNELHRGLRVYRVQLVDAIERERRRPRSRPWSTSAWIVRFAVPALAVASAAAVVLVVLTSGGSGVPSANAAVLRGVAAALTPPSGSILHERALVTVGDQPPQRYELWEQTGTGAYRVVKFGREASWNGSAMSTYEPGSDTIVSSRAGSSPGNGAPDDAAVALRSLVESGNARVVATTTLDGVSAYRLAVEGATARYLNGTVYVAVSDYRPLLIQTDFVSVRDGSETGTETIRYEAYEYLPADAANRALLDLAAQHPSARVLESPALGGTGTTTTSSTS